MERIRLALVSHYMGGISNTSQSCYQRAIAPWQETIESLINRADQALYKAKAAGRNCVLDEKVNR
jgi:GGDEF domain-containing protein